MSDSRLKKVAVETAALVASALLSPLGATIKIVAAALDRPGLAETAIATLQEDIVRLHEEIIRKVSELTTEQREGLNAEELIEVIMQVHAKMASTASSTKRALLRNVAINGIEPEHEDGLELRMILQAVADLDLAHIEILRASVEHELNVIELPSGDIGYALADGLEARGFARPIQRAGTSLDAMYNIPMPPTYEVTALGVKFVSFLRDPEWSSEH